MRITFAVLAALAAANAPAQETIDLAAVQRQAAAADPRLRKLELEAAQSALWLENLRAERRPALAVEGQAQHQSDVARFPFTSPDGGAPPGPPRDTFDAHVGVEKTLVDPTSGPRADAERARLAEARARVRAELYGLRHEVNEAFFAAAVVQEREGQVAAAITDLDARLGEARLRVEQGVALPSEPAALEVALLQRRQDLAALRAARRAALARLSDLAGRSYGTEDRLALPDVAADSAQARARLDALRARPEFAQFARTRERLEAEKAIAGASDRPRVSAYGRAGLGRPGLDFISSDVSPYWIAGVRVSWKPASWGVDRRQREILALQQQAARADEDAFARGLRRGIQEDLAAIDQLAETAAFDDRIVALRETIEAETRALYEERVVTAAAYVDAQTDVLEARLARAQRRVELARARSRFLTLVGLEVQ